MTGLELIMMERQRQISEEGWTLQHDIDAHCSGELAAAAAHMLEGNDIEVTSGAWNECDWIAQLHDRHRDPVRRLVIAGALIAAEIDRLQAKMEKVHVPLSTDDWRIHKKLGEDHLPGTITQQKPTMDGLVGKRVSVVKNGGSYFYSHTGTCLAYYIEPNPMGDGRLNGAIHLLCDDGRVINLHVYPGLVEILVLNEP